MVRLHKLRRTGHKLQGLSRSFQSAQEESLPLAFMLSVSGWLEGITEYFSPEKKCLCRRQDLLIIGLQLNELKFNSSCLSPMYVL